MLDLDYFKRINDLLSHEVGDEVLRAIGRLLTRFAAAVPDGVAARIGGEEFLLVLPGIAGEAAAVQFEALCRSISSYDRLPVTGGLAVTASIGVVVAPADGLQRSGLLRTADRRLYLAKHAGRNRVVAA